MRMCQYGGCTKDVTMSATSGGVSVNYHNQEKPVFCSGLHAALWLLMREGYRDITALDTALNAEKSRVAR